MENKINIVEILKNCPSGMELDCTMYEDVTLIHVFEGSAYPIKIKTPDGQLSLNEYGQYSHNKLAKCIIFPKGKKTWEGFHRPFKDGDIVSTENGMWVGIVERKVGNAYKAYTTIYDGAILYNDDTFCFKRFATEYEKQKLFDAIKSNGYKWNEETKTLEKLIEPKFKVGDRIQSKNFIEERTIKICEEDGYWTTVDSWIRISDQDNWELVPNKFDITTLKPFESRVLVRNHNHHYWRISFFGFFDKNKCVYDTIRGIYSQCIPYEGNEHLCGTTNDCDNFYKTWE